ncbi:MAG TPA: chemoreceptor glutamine deamidase CheD [Mizugakiibacter sp.]|nr:chemoreceptor glutamine deamidase CheD [Mizugakiibacter sp.]
MAGFDPQRLRPGFEHVNRYWDPHLSLVAVKILPGEYYVTCQGELVVTVLGSCVAACVRDRETGIGGMNHFMLPESNGDAGGWSDAGTRATRYGSDAMEHLINEILKAGGHRERFEIKIFGGTQGFSDVGQQNIDFVHRYVKTEGLRLVAEDLGGAFPRHVRYLPKTGKVHQRKLRSMHNTTIIDRERGYLEKLRQDPLRGEIELF